MRKAVRRSVDGQLTWGFVVRHVFAGGRLRTHDRVGVGGVVDQLMAALDALALADLDGFASDGLLDLSRDLVAAGNRLQALLAQTVRTAENRQAFARDGATPASWLRGHGRLSPGAASQVVRNGRALEQLPAVSMGFGVTISAARARWAACDADITRIVLGPNGEPLDLGRRPRCRGPRRACEAWGAAGSFHSPGAGRRTGGPRSTTSSTGPRAARHHWPTVGCSANATTPRSTTGSPSNEIPPADGTPTAPTAPRSSPAGPRRSMTRRCPKRGRAFHRRPIRCRACS